MNIFIHYTHRYIVYDCYRHILLFLFYNLSECEVKMKESVGIGFTIMCVIFFIDFKYYLHKGASFYRVV